MPRYRRLTFRRVRAFNLYIVLKKTGKPIFVSQRHALAHTMDQNYVLPSKILPQIAQRFLIAAKASF